MPNSQELRGKIPDVPPDRMGEVEDFMDYPSTKARQQATLDHLLALAPTFEAAGAPPLTDDDFQAEVDAVRAKRRMQSASAHRS